jgi:hypothetical protein
MVKADFSDYDHTADFMGCVINLLEKAETNTGRGLSKEDFQSLRYFTLGIKEKLIALLRAELERK